jgi:predicted nucleotidyltransferase
VTIEGTMPGGGINRVEIAVCSIPALLAMKGYAMAKRNKQKDAYDIYYCVRNYPDGAGALAEACRPLLDEKSAREGYAYIAEKFTTVGHVGPVWVKQFAEGQRILEERTPEQWQTDAFGQVDAWLRALGLRG